MVDPGPSFSTPYSTLRGACLIPYPAHQQHITDDLFDADSSAYAKSVNSPYNAVLCHQSDVGDVFAQRIRVTVSSVSTSESTSDCGTEASMPPVQTEYVLEYCDSL